MAAPPADATTTGGMPMQGMHGMAGMGADSMMAGMQMHMQIMAGASADSVKAMLPRHRRMVANMMAQMNQQMRQMNMQGDARWTATVDSIRQDLVHMPEMTPSELKAMMPAHRERVMRLMQMHQAMMRGM